jgi:hypothetical protein
MERLSFGDNQFFGINHVSEQRARALQLRFQDVWAIDVRPMRDRDWVCRLPNLPAIVFGACSSRNIRATRELVDQYWRP